MQKMIEFNYTIDVEPSPGANHKQAFAIKEVFEAATVEDCDEMAKGWLGTVKRNPAHTKCKLTLRRIDVPPVAAQTTVINSVNCK